MVIGKLKKEKGQIGLLKETWASGSVPRQYKWKIFRQQISPRKQVDGLKLYINIWNW